MALIRINQELRQPTFLDTVIGNIPEFNPYIASPRTFGPAISAAVEQRSASTALNLARATALREIINPYTEVTNRTLPSFSTSGSMIKTYSTASSDAIRGSLSGLVTPSTRASYQELLSSFGTSSIPESVLATSKTGLGLTPPPVASLGLKMFEGRQTTYATRYAGVIGQDAREASLYSVNVTNPNELPQSYYDALQQSAFDFQRDIARQFGMLGSSAVSQVNYVRSALGISTPEAVGLIREEYGLSPVFSLGGRTYGLTGQERIAAADKELLGTRSGEYSPGAYNAALNRIINQATATAERELNRATSVGRYPLSAPDTTIADIPVAPKTYGRGIDDTFSESAINFGQQYNSLLPREQTTTSGGGIGTVSIPIPSGIDSATSYQYGIFKTTGVDLDLPRTLPKEIKPVKVLGGGEVSYELPSYLQSSLPSNLSTRYSDLYAPVSSTVGAPTLQIRPEYEGYRQQYNQPPQINVFLDLLNY